jgi:hypothetical protein
LLLIRESVFISRQQIELLIAGRTNELDYRNRNRRLARLVELGQIQTHPQCFPYPGRVFSITAQGMVTLDLVGQGLLSASWDTKRLTDDAQTLHFLVLNEIQIAARKVFNIRRWIGDKELKSLNIAVNHPTQKDYDSIMELSSLSDANVAIRVGIEYERTVKSKERYAQIRKNLEAETQIQGVLYFVENETSAAFVSRVVYSEDVPVGVIVVSQFQSKGADALMRVVQNRTVVNTSVRDYLKSLMS